MAETAHPVCGTELTCIEPDDRLVVLARTMQVAHPDMETALKDGCVNWKRFGQTCLGQALYRHRAVFQNAAQSPVWSHLELSYFRNIVPAEAIHELVTRPRLLDAGLLRAEILLTTPSSFVVPRNWKGSSGRREWQASLEYIHVAAPHLDAYRNVMREFCGPAAAWLVRTERFGTFRAMETAAVLYRMPGLETEWNQIHLCALDPDGFDGFGRAFEAALREKSSNGLDSDGAFAGLDRMRRIPLWTFNDPVVEADTALARHGQANVERDMVRPPQ